MFVGKKDGVDVFQRFARIVEELAEFPLGKSRVDQHTGTPGPQHGAIARTAAGEDG